MSDGLPESPEDASTPEDVSPPEEASTTEEPPVVQAEALFGEQREVVIELAGVRYRLRITRRNRLILTK